MRVLKDILRYIAPYWNKGVMSVIFSILGTTFSLFSFTMAIPFLGILFNNEQMVHDTVPFQMSVEALRHNFYYFLTQIIESEGQAQALAYLSVFIVFMVLFKTVFNYLANLTLIPLINGIIRDFRNKIYKKIVDLPIAYYSEEKKGDVMLKATGDVQEVANTILQPLRQTVQAPIKIIIYISALFYMNYKLTLFALILIPVSGYLIALIGKNLKKTSVKGQNKLGVLLSIIEETLYGLRIIKAFNSEERVNNKFRDENNQYTRLMNKIFRKRILAQPTSEFLSTTVIVIIMWFGGSLVLNAEGALSPQALMAYLAIFSQIIQPAKVVSNYYYNVKKGMASYDRINSLLDAEVTIREKPDAKELEGFKDSVVYHNLSFKYTNEWVLKNINLEIKKGETVAIVGQSGAGKTTLVNLLPRFYDATKGDILIDGLSIQDLKVKSLRSIMGLVSQESILFNDTVFNNIAFGRDNVSEEEVIHAAKVANAHIFIKDLDHDYQTNIGDQGNKLSGGQRQRVSIARAVLKNPPLLILDEATSALDTESEKLVQDALDQLMSNRTSIIIAHRLSTVREADKIVVLQDGEIHEIGSHNELIEHNGIYKKLHEMQMFS